LMSGVMFDDGPTAQEYRDRVARIQAAMVREGYDLLLLFADVTRSGNTRYIFDVTPGWGVSDICFNLAAVPVDGDPVGFVSAMNYDWAAEVSYFPVKTFAEMPEELRRLGSRAGKGAVGLVGMDIISVGVSEVVKGAFGLLNISSIDFRRADGFFGAIRAQKSATEIALLRKAAKGTIAALQAIADAVEAGEPVTERDLLRRTTRAVVDAGADGWGYNPLIQFGSHSHYNCFEPSDRRYRPGDSVLADFGARYGGYVNDIGRGMVLRATDKRQEDIIKVTAAAMDEACGMLKPGVTAGEVADVLARVIAHHGYADFSTEAQGHGAGHGIGIDVEEHAPWIRQGATFVFEENTFFSLKASIFIPGLAGCRIEDNILVTSAGCENLTDFPRVNVFR
jgi:Xaa-Pro aminopeptidase